MEIGVLGGLSARLATGNMQLGTPKQQALLAMLVTQPEHPMTVDQLVDELWPEHPPRSAVPNVPSYAANLRRMFDAGGIRQRAIDQARTVIASTPVHHVWTCSSFRTSTPRPGRRYGTET